ncbi:zinc finger CCCH domain-containing protein 21-like [Brassica rapa]|uniref:zinc finger CCCH domain-containing protein 21-like n=1 Tax=Brassica campestris TaxID=3711 RepID=UPI00142D8B2A|nr:zinc finger CCCH domain-containing protein 21-like [Brassica rapa]
MLDLEEHAIDDDLTFDIEILKGKKLSLKELCEDSSSTNVTMENVTQYVDLYLKHRFLNTISKKHLFAKGFSDMLLGSALHTSFFQVCKYFLDAVEKKQYGWFWACPNGGKECHYRHALPPGYILKSQMKALLEEESQKMPVEEEIENEHAKLKTATQMTPALFMEWKKKKIAESRESMHAAL